MYFALELGLVDFCVGHEGHRSGNDRPLDNESVVKTNVLILGGGIAGLAAAKTLMKKNITDFIIIEGYSQIGGRVRETKLGNWTVELGANWIHINKGSKDNPLWLLKEQHNISGKYSDYEDYTFRDQTRKNASIVLQEAEKSWERFEPVFKKLANVSDNDQYMSLRTAMGEEHWRPLSPIDNVVEMFDVDFEYGDTPDLTSTQYFVDPTDFFITDQRGFRYMLTEMASEFLPQNTTKLRLNETVSDIWYDDKSVTVKTDKTVYKSNYAIITFSLGVLQNEHVKFSPELPGWKRNIIQSMRLAHYTQIFIQFNETFWDDVEYILYAHNRRGFYPMFQNLDLDGLLKGSHILLVPLMGDECLRSSRLSNEELESEIMDILREQYGPNIPSPVGIVVNRWSTDPLFMGCFSNWPPEVSTYEFKAMEAKVGRLYFAGEATWTPIGYTHSAYYSGVREAEKIEKCMKSLDCDAVWPSTTEKTTRSTDRIPQSCPTDTACAEYSSYIFFRIVATIAITQLLGGYADI